MQRLFIFRVLPPMLGCLLLPLSALADVTKATQIAPAGAPKSEFVDEPGFGKDPFFPKSTRRIPKPPVKLDEEKPREPDFPEFVALKGISVLQGKKLAIINNYTVEQGENFTLKFNGQVFKLQCIEIKEKSVTLNYGGVIKDLPLRAGLN